MGKHEKRTWPAPVQRLVMQRFNHGSANREPRVEARKRKTLVFKASSRAVMIPKKNAIRPVDVTFTNCAPNTSDTENAVRIRTTKADERYNIKFRGRAKRFG